MANDPFKSLRHKISVLQVDCDKMFFYYKSKAATLMQDCQHFSDQYIQDKNEAILKEKLDALNAGVQSLKQKMQFVKKAERENAILYLAQVCSRFQNKISGYVIYGTYKIEYLNSLPHLSALSEQMSYNGTQKQRERWDEICDKYSWPHAKWDSSNTPDEIYCIINFSQLRIPIAHPKISTVVAHQIYEEWKNSDLSLQYFGTILQKFEQLPV